MDLPAFRELLTPTGQAAIRAAESLPTSDSAFLSNFDKLRKAYPEVLVKAALETVLLRVRAREKFAPADRMYFTREALEQSTGDVVSRHRAARFAPFGVVADLCAGIGGDTLALADAGLTVHAVEHDPLRAEMLIANVTSLGHMDRVYVHESDALTVELADVRAVFADPARRSGGRRHLDPEEYSPPLSRIRGRFPHDFPLGVKVAPGVAHTHVDDLNAELEFVSVAGELKECVLWFGPLRTATRRATLLPAAETRSSSTIPELPPLATVGEYLFDPDPAIVRAGLVGLIAGELDLNPIDAVVGLLTGNECVSSQLVSSYRVEMAERFNARRLRLHLRNQSVGRVTVIKRGSLLDAEEMTKQLKLTGPNHRVVLLTRIGDEQVMVVGERM